jgi:hypothetical protein
MMKERLMNGKRKIRMASDVLILAAAMYCLPATADDDSYGCKVVLCLANPASNGGPRAPDTCAPAIDRLYDDLRHGRGFPQCTGSGMSVRQLYTPFDPCPAGTTAAATGALVVQGAAGEKRASNGQSGGFNLTGTPQPSATQGDAGNGYGPLACVGKLVGTYQTGSDAGDDLQTVSVYDRIVWQQPQSPNALDVYEAGQFEQRIHY